MALLATGAPARAASSQQCIAASERGQELRDAGKLRESGVQFLVCAQQECPSVVRKGCTKWYSELEARIPTVVLRAQRSGRDLLDVTVTMDGAPLARGLDGKPVAIDPGQHVFRAEWPGAPSADQRTVEQTALIGESEKGRAILFTFPVPAPLTVPIAAEHPGRGLPTGAIVLGGLALVGIGSFAYFGTKGLKEADNYRATCGPNCSPDARAEVKRDYLIADVSLAAGAVFLGLATWQLLAHGNSSKTAAPPAVQVSVTPVRAGAAVGLSGSFGGSF